MMSSCANTEAVFISCYIVPWYILIFYSWICRKGNLYDLGIKIWMPQNKCQKQHKSFLEKSQLTWEQRSSVPYILYEISVYGGISLWIWDQWKTYTTIQRCCLSFSSLQWRKYHRNPHYKDEMRSLHCLIFVMGILYMENWGFIEREPWILEVVTNWILEPATMKFHSDSQGCTKWRTRRTSPPQADFDMAKKWFQNQAEQTSSPARLINKWNNTLLIILNMSYNPYL